MPNAFYDLITARKIKALREEFSSGTDVYYDVTLTAAGQAITAPAVGVETAAYRIRQDATGNRIPTWFAGISWLSTDSITLTPSKLTVVVVASDGAGGWIGSVVYGGTAATLPTPAPTISATTTTTATATWAAISGATGYNVRVNGGATVDVGNVLTYQATGLPHSTAGTIEVKAYNTNVTSTWASAGFTTVIPAATIIRLTPNHASVTESGNATDGWNYAFNATPYGSGAVSALTLAANTDGFVEYTVGALTSGVINPTVFFANAATSNTAQDTYIGVGIATNLEYTARHLGTNFTGVISANADKVKIGRTGMTYYAQYSRNGGSTWTDLRRYTATTAPRLWVSVMDNNYTGQVNNVRALSFS